jgi:hypothetical protein
MQMDDLKKKPKAEKACRKSNMLQRCGKGADGSHAFERITDGQWIPIGIIDPIRRVKE